MVLLRSDCPLAPQPASINPPENSRGRKMRVKFKKKSRWAHSNQALGQFDHEVGEVISGISEEDVVLIEKAGIGECVGPDEVVAPEEVDLDSDDDSNDSDNKEDDGSKKPWG